MELKFCMGVEEEGMGLEEEFVPEDRDEKKTKFSRTETKTERLI